MNMTAPIIGRIVVSRLFMIRLLLLLQRMEIRRRPELNVSAVC